MTPIRWLLLASMTACVGAGLAVTGWMQPRPRLARALAQIAETQLRPIGSHGPVRAQDLLQSNLIEPLTNFAPILLGDEDLRLLGRSPQQHVALLLVAAVAGGLAPGILVGLFQALGLLELKVFVPAVVMLFGSIVVPLVVHRKSVERAEQVRRDLRYQLSAFLDVVTMLLAGNTGHEGALLRAAQAGDGRLFGELSLAMREAIAAGRSMVSGLEHTGISLGLIELRQVAATVSLSAAEGSPVARSLSAKCATLRSTLASEQETEARLRTSRLTTPLVGMGLIFMALVIYPALQM